MEILQAELTTSQTELLFLRQCIDLATIPAKEAKFVAQLQFKLEAEIQALENLKLQREAEKQEKLEEIKASKKK